jgi:glycosyltransferase involved in cell wall biosynthesis
MDPDLRLIMLGKGSQEKEILRLLEQSGCIDKVYIAGNVGFEDLVEHYHAADLYISASLSDGSSISLLEAMACGLPVIVSDIPGNREWIKPGENGSFFQVDDIEGIAHEILQVSDQDQHWKRMSSNNRKTVEARANWASSVQKLLEAYEACVAISRR